MVECGISGKSVKQGGNRIELNTPGDTGVAAEITHMDWVALDYPTKLKAAEDMLVFRAQAGERLLSGFSGDVKVWDISNPDESQPVSTVMEGRTIRMRAEDGRIYLAVGEQGELVPASIENMQLEPDLRSLGSGNYLAIGPGELLAAANPLFEWRRVEGFQIVSAPYEAVRDQFGYGYPAPEAIARLVRYASENWNPAPAYVLLVGDSTYDPHGYQALPEANQLPIFFVDTVYGGQTASDVGFVQLDDDDWPDLPLGRLPARTPQQVSTAVAKIIAYEQSATQFENGIGILAIADGQEGHFQAEAQAFIDQFGGTLTSDLYTPPPGTNDAPAEITRRLADDPLLVAYFGHGSVNMWGKDHLFSVEDVGPAPGQERLPVVVNMTCLNGLFTHPDIRIVGGKVAVGKRGRGSSSVGAVQPDATGRPKLPVTGVCGCFCQPAGGEAGRYPPGGAGGSAGGERQCVGRDGYVYAVWRSGAKSAADERQCSIVGQATFDPRPVDCDLESEQAER